MPTRIVDATCPTSSTSVSAATPSRAPTLRWQQGDVPVAEWEVLLGARRVPVKLIVARIDPSRIALSLEIARVGDALGPWSIGETPPDALIAFNAGQFSDAGPWGWVMHRGREWQAPGVGSLAAAFAVDSAGRVRVVAADSVSVVRRHGGLAEVVQSYPQLRAGGTLAPALCREGAINRAHRDIRLALGVRTDGHVIVALSRYAPAVAVAGVTERLPIGPTTLEMAEIMGRLGAVDAVMLDGGLSAQLRVRNGTADRQWPGLRTVPLAVVGRRR
ncbi:phosphodiester glycosidase family protein [Gemmatimonas sp.]|uniref:phosphodiester glycosidase family protein n=1 Tax=Gemmatimonas sp. TaxID=1962908 RepID=UPI00333EA6ED